MFGENTVLAYTPTLSGLKEDIIVAEYTGQLSYDFLIHTHGMRILEQDGKWVVKKPGNGNKETFELGAVQIYDSAGNFCVGEMTVTAQNNGSKYILTLTAPEEFMTDPNTVYPVTIDPTIEVSDNVTGAGAIEDSVIYSGTPDANYGGFTYLTVGYNGSTYGIGRALFRLPGLYNSVNYVAIEGSQIQSVYFYAWDASGHNDEYINLYMTSNGDWTENGVTWSNNPWCSAQYNFGAEMPSNDYACFDITNLVKLWKTGMFPKEAGFTLVNPHETSETYKKVPCSSETAVTTRRPYVVMTYVPEISLDSSLIEIPVGLSHRLYVTTDANATVTWSSNNPSVATVTETGLVVGVNAGPATITASITDTDGTTYTASCGVYVIVENGVYSVNSVTSSYRIELLGIDSYQSNSPLFVWNTHGDETTARYSLFKIRYLGSGLYSIRSMVNSTMGWMRSGNYLVCSDIGTSDSTVPEAAKWYIVSDENGFAITNYYGTSYTITHPATVDTSSSIAYQQYSSNNLRQHWHLTRVYDSYNGVDIREKTDVLIVGNTFTFSATMYSSVSGVNGQNGIFWSVTNGSGSATINPATGVLTAVSSGTVTVTAEYEYTASVCWQGSYVLNIITHPDPLHPTNIEYVRYTKNPVEDTQFYLHVVKSSLYEYDWFIVENKYGKIDFYYITDELIDKLNTLEEEYQSNFLPTWASEEESIAHFAKLETDQLVETGYILEGSSEYYGAWVHNCIKSAEIISDVETVLNTAIEVFGVYISVATYYYSNMYANPQYIVSTSQYSSAANQIDDIATFMTNNPSSSKVMLGTDDGTTSWYNLGKTNNMTYFYSSEWDLLKNQYGDDIITAANRKFIYDQVAAGKEFYFSHDPTVTLTQYQNSYFAKELGWLKGAYGITNFSSSNFAKYGSYWKFVP